jgi:hypothetical protein
MGPKDDDIKRLHAFLRSVSVRPFAWGSWDCLIFTNEAYRAMHGDGWADDLMHRYMQGSSPITRSQAKREYGYETVEDMLSDRMTRVDGIPPRGALVTGSPENIEAGYLGVSFGISVGTSAAFLSPVGVVYCPIEDIESAWVRDDAA